VIASLGAKKLASADELTTRMVSAVPELSEDAGGLVGAGVHLMGEVGCDPAEAKSMAEEVALSDELSLERDQQATFQERLTALLCSPSIRFTAKALELSVDYENVFSDCRILTDVRPVFPDDLEDMAAAVIVDNLRISYFDRDGDLSTFFLAMDQKDLLALREEIDRALEKNKSMRSFLGVSQVDHLPEADVA
jgi:hypothetical protein